MHTHSPLARCWREVAPPVERLDRWACGWAKKNPASGSAQAGLKLARCQRGEEQGQGTAELGRGQCPCIAALHMRLIKHLGQFNIMIIIGASNGINDLRDDCAAEAWCTAAWCGAVVERRRGVEPRMPAWKAVTGRPDQRMRTSYQLRPARAPGAILARLKACWQGIGAAQAGEIQC
jgi:hypothetical protein